MKLKTRSETEANEKPTKKSRKITGNGWDELESWGEWKKLHILVQTYLDHCGKSEMKAMVVVVVAAAAVLSNSHQNFSIVEHTFRNMYKTIWFDVWGQTGFSSFLFLSHWLSFYFSLEHRPKWGSFSNYVYNAMFRNCA